MSSRSGNGPFRRPTMALGVIALLVGGAAFAPSVAADPGSVYTTDGAATNNQNTRYAGKEQVLLTAGECKGGSRLADGRWYFEVTDPSTKNVLSQATLATRWFEVSGGTILATGGIPVGTVCGTGRYIELMPYGDTTSPGGEYKLTIATERSLLACGGDRLPASIAGCPHAATKTDTFKVNFDATLTTRISPTSFVVGSVTTVTDTVTLTGDAAEGYPHGDVTLYLCPGTSCSATTAGARIVATFPTATGGKETKGVLTVVATVAIPAKDLSVGTYTANAVYRPANQVAYNVVGDTGVDETFQVTSAGGGGGGGGGGGASTATPTPAGSVAGVTSPPKATLPPTDVAATPASRPTDGAVTLLLLGLLATLTAAGALVPVRRRIDRR